MKKHWFCRHRGRNKFKNHWFYCKTSPGNGPRDGFGVCISNIRSGKLLRNPYRQAVFGKSNGFTVSVEKMFKQTLVLQCPSKEVVKKHWFCSVRRNKCETSIGFTVSVEKVVKSIGFTVSVEKSSKQALVF